MTGRPDALTLDKAYTAGLDREWDRLAATGTWWTGPERVAIAATARADGDGEDPPAVALPPAAAEAAARLSADPHVDDRWVSGLEEQGLGRAAYTEILGIVSRLNAVDTFLFGLGRGSRPLPEPETGGTPSRQAVAEAELQGAIVPTVGPPFPPTALSAVPAESDALLDLHGVLYLSIEEMGDLEIVKDLTRSQIELVAARTSLLNECFF